MAGLWKGDILIAEDLEKLDASTIYLQTINAKDVLTSQKRDEFKFPVVDGTAKLSGRDHEFREPTLRREQTEGAKISVDNFKANWKGLNRQNQMMTLKPGETCGRFKVTSSIVITLNQESNFTRRERNRSLFH